MSPISLERALLLYSQNVSEKPFDIKLIPAEEQVVETKKDSQGPSSLPSNKPTEKLASRQDVYGGKSLFLYRPLNVCPVLLTHFDHRISEQLAAIPEYSHLGHLFKSSAPIDLTEAETEYVVKCIKHTFSNYIVFQVRLQSSCS